jgi:hypothetical protein
MTDNETLYLVVEIGSEEIDGPTQELLQLIADESHKGSLDVDGMRFAVDITRISTRSP